MMTGYLGDGPGLPDMIVGQPAAPAIPTAAEQQVHTMSHTSDRPPEINPGNSLTPNDHPPTSPAHLIGASQEICEARLREQQQQQQQQQVESESESE